MCFLNFDFDTVLDDDESFSLKCQMFFLRDQKFKKQQSIILHGLPR